MIWKFRERELSLAAPRIMGIVNVTPDSFSDGGCFFDSEAAIRQALTLIEDGADLIDLGAESTRPGASAVSAEEEAQRILPVLQKLRPLTGIPISIDTTKPQVAELCLKEGADIINDVGGLKSSGAAMAEAVRDFGAGLVLMHRRGDPETMQTLTDYQDVVRDVMTELRESIDLAVRNGVPADHLAIDPGIGFAKTAEQCFFLLKHIDEFLTLGYPVVLGASRKSFLGKKTDSGPEDRDFATAAVSAYAVMKGIPVLRVHHVKATRDAVKTIQAIREVNYVGA